MKDSVIEQLKQEIEGFSREIRAEKIGRVLEVGDGIAKILEGMTTPEEILRTMKDD